MTTTAWDTTSAHRVLPGLGVGVAVLALLPSLLLTVLRLVPPHDGGPSLLASFIPYALVGYAVAALGFGVALVRSRRRLGSAVALVLTLALVGVHVAWLAPLFTRDDRPATGPGFSLLSLNTLQGAADPDDLVAQAQRADVVVLLETTPHLVEELADRGLGRRFPNSVGAGPAQVSDAVVFSRFALSDAQTLGGTRFQQWAVTLAVPGAAPVRLVAAHPCNPYCGPGWWPSDHRLVRAAALADRNAPVVVAGDFNAVDDHRPMLQLRRDGFRSAADLTGAGWLPTFPANHRIPPLIAIDHVLLNGRLTATSVERVRVRGTDHLGLLAAVAPAG